MLPTVTGCKRWREVLVRSGRTAAQVVRGVVRGVVDGAMEPTALWGVPWSLGEVKYRRTLGKEMCIPILSFFIVKF